MKRIFTALLFYVIFATSAQAQTLNLSGAASGTYGQNSSISVRVNVNNSTGCIAQNNVFNLYLSDASGNFASEKLIGSFTGFYATYVNGVIPAGTPAGTNYQLRLKSTSPAVVSAPSTPITIVPAQGVSASITSQTISAAYPDIFGSCSGADNTTYGFTNQSTSGSAVSASFYNELSQTDEGSLTLAPSANFSAKAANYTITVNAVNNGIIGTKSYTLINNVINSSFGTTGSNTICLKEATNAGLTYNVDITTANGIQRNFPGLVYKVKWGDGTNGALTLCDIVAAGGKLNHIYTQSSCGNVTGAQNNVFEVDLQATSPYCGNVGTQVTSYAKVLNPATNHISGPAVGCTGTNITFNNASFPGQDPNASTTDCRYANAQYTWIADGVQFPNYNLTQPFLYTFTTTGVHHVTLRLQNNNGLCPAADITQDICIQDPPKASFTIPASVCLAGGVVTPTNTSVIDVSCAVPPTYAWTVTGPAAVSYAGATSAASAQPQFVFNQTGTYQVQLSITGGACGAVTTPVQTVIVNSVPVITLSPNVPLCGNNQTLTFNPDPGPTQTTTTGTVDQSATYFWLVTPPAGAGAATFVNGTTAFSQYPQIMFPDYGTYTVAVAAKNACGVDYKTQIITLQQAPSVNIAALQPICPGSPVTINGSVDNNAYKSFKWIGGTGTFSPDRTSSLTPTYIPSAAEIAAGTVTLTLDVTTNLQGQCSDIQKNVTININPVNTINSAATLATCTGNPLNYDIKSTVTGSTYSWTAKLISGNAMGFSASGSGNTINDAVVDNDPVNNAVVQYTITPNSAGCDGAAFTLTVTVAPVPTIVGATDNVICSNQPANILLASNAPSRQYIWTSSTTGNITGNTNQSTPTVATSIQDVLVNNSTQTATVTYTITPIGNCAGNPVVVKITVQPLPVPSVPGPDAEVCSTTTYQLKGNDPSPGVGKWTVESGQAGITFSDDTQPNATVSGLIPGNVYKFRWTITNASTCSPTTNVMALTIDNLTVAGTTSGTVTTCAGSNSGTVILTGQSGKILRWEASIDNGTSWQMVNNITTTLQYVNLAQTTQYRAVVQSGVCSILPSTITTITVNPPAVAANAGTDQILCSATTATLYGNNPAPFTGYWKQIAGTAVTIVSPDSPQTDITGLVPGNSYNFAWVVRGLAPCVDNQDEVVITDQIDIKPSFTADQTSGCGAYTANFTNTSNNLNSGKFSWDFGDGSQLSTVNAIHTFQPRTDGKDTTYVVSLNVVNNCAVRAAFTLVVTVRPAAPVVSILPNNLSGCAPVTVSVRNTSPGNNKNYTFYLYDGTMLVQQIVLDDKSDAVFNPVSPKTTKTYTVYMDAVDQCGNTAETKHIPLLISPATIIPQIFAQGNNTKGCAPFTPIFVNNTNGGTSFFYNIYDANNKLIDKRSAGTADFPYQFTTPGTYYVSITAIDNCTTIESDKIRIDVSQTPVSVFTADITTGCNTLSVQFTNQTKATDAEELLTYKYDWDFGDGSPHSFMSNPLPHVYTSQQASYTVTLTATNSVTGCLGTSIMKNYITVNAPPVAAFTIKPDSVINIPDYQFSFYDSTNGSVKRWQWSFGDGQFSTSQNPQHTYRDTGLYKVTLLVTSAQGCSSAVTYSVRIKGTPGQLYMPNAFMPNGLNTELRTFAAKGSGIKEWRLQIFNNWGQLIWETHALGSQGTPVDGWDGTYKGTPVAQGVYMWQATATFINGTQWKGMSYNGSTPARSGSINLIR